MIAIGCLIQWYEIEMVEEYINSLKISIGNNKSKTIIDLCLCVNQNLEKVSDEISLEDYIIRKFNSFCEELKKEKYIVNSYIREDLYTIADYRRNFNTCYSNEADVLFWGESDMLVPSQAIQTILYLNEATKSSTPKWVGFFSTCKMWDDSWKILEHPKLTNLPRDAYAWYGTRSYMTYDKMEEINNNVESPQIDTSFNYKFNGCGLIMSSALIKSGVNIPQNVFFTHEDTALMNSMITIFGDQQIPFYIIKNILLVHNREHPSKRLYVKGEEGKDITEKRKSNSWYKIASEYSKYNAYNFMKQSKTYNWKDVWNSIK